MWPKLRQCLAQFPTTVITGLDAAGYPISFRCTPQADDARQVLIVSVPSGVSVQPGPAGLLCHSHNDELWDLKNFAAQGRLEQDAGRWVFQPHRLLLGAGTSGPFGDFQLLINSRRAAQAYLTKRNLPRPVIPWAEIKALRAAAKKDK
jgi:hypothetical protein